MFGAAKVMPAISPAPPPAPVMLRALKASPIPPALRPVSVMLRALKTLSAIPTALPPVAPTAGTLKTLTALDPTSPPPIKASLKYDRQTCSSSALHPWQPNSPPDCLVNSDSDGTGRLKFSPHPPPERFPVPAVSHAPTPAPLRAVCNVEAEPPATKGKKSLLQQCLEIPVHSLHLNGCFEGPMWSHDGKMFPTRAIPQAEGLGPAATQPLMFEAPKALPAVPPAPPRTPLVLGTSKVLLPVLPAPPHTPLMIGASIPTDEERVIPRSGALEREIVKRLDQEAKKCERAGIMAPPCAPPMGSSSVLLPPYLRPICDLTSWPLTPVSTIKREWRKTDRNEVIPTVVKKVSQLVPRRSQQRSKANKENKSVEAVNVLPIENCPLSVQPCGAPPAVTPPCAFDESKFVHTNQVTECDISWWLQRDRALRISKRLRSTKRRGRRNISQVKQITHGPPVEELVARTHKALIKKKIKGWEKRTASRRRVHTRKFSPSWSRHGWAQGALIQILVHIYHVFTLLILRCTAVTWLTDLILSSGLIRGRIS